MLTHFLLRGLSAATALGRVLAFGHRRTRAQDILKELEQNEQGQTHEHPTATNMLRPIKKKQNAAKKDDHKGHKSKQKRSIASTAGTGGRTDDAAHQALMRRVVRFLPPVPAVLAMLRFLLMPFVVIFFRGILFFLIGRSMFVAVVLVSLPLLILL